jgi:death on curing protein
VNWLVLEAIYAIHELELVERGGAPGIRDAGLIESALARAQNKSAYANPSIDDLAAAYLFGFPKNHGFVDGNKRIAFLAADTLLRRNGYEIHATQPGIIAFVLSVAAGECDEEFASLWIGEHRRRL